VPVFSEPPQEGNAIYIGHVESLGGQTLALRFQCRMEGVGVDPRDPPLAWEAWSEEEEAWLPVDVESDTTGGLNRDGTVVIHVPYDASRSVINNVEAAWVRCRATRPRPNQRGYGASPQVRRRRKSSAAWCRPARPEASQHSPRPRRSRQIRLEAAQLPASAAG
jgi:hypothetical protein